MKPLNLDLATPVTWLILIGGGEFSFGETREIDAFALSKMPADRRTIAFLPTASGSAEYAGHLGKYLHDVDAAVNVANVPVYRGRDNRRQKNLDAIGNAGMVYIGGGVSNALIEVLLESPAAEALQSAAAAGTVVTAIGAAASCFGIRVHDMRGVTPALPGLGWLQHTVVETAFSPENDSALRRLMSLPDVTLGIGIPAGTALAIDASGSAQLLGSGTVTVFRKG